MIIMKKSDAAPIVIAVVLLAVTIAVSAVGKPATQRGKQPKSTSATVSQAAPPAKEDETLDDMRGVWISYLELSMENAQDKSERAFREKFAAIAADCQGFGFNTLVVQVRPFCDALYRSELFPPSHILSGTQGQDAGYDALQIMCETCRKFGLRLHAWVNPYRVSTNQTPSVLADENPYRKDPSLGIETDSGVILDPSDEAARKLIVDGIREIVEHYDVDGIQFDDYFYPTDIGDLDDESYQAYRKTVPDGAAMSRETWRSFHVSLLLSETFLTVHRLKSNVVFGVSPQGNLDNNKELSADVLSWCGKRGFVDYICPQIYFSPDNPALGFADALDRWTQAVQCDSVRLYVGLAGYKAGSDKDEGTWQDRDDILAEEVNILKKNQKVKGWMLYSYASLQNKAAQAELKNMKTAIQKK